MTIPWSVVRFGELYFIPSRNGLNRPSAVRGKGFKMINMGEIFAHNRLYNIDMELVLLNDREKKTHQVLAGDLIFARQSIVAEGAGKCSIIMSVSDMTCFESHIIRVRLDKKKTFSLFYYYFFQSELGKSFLFSIRQQGVQAGIRGSDLAKTKIPLPPLPTQQKIAQILSAYDDLIENNLKRIKLLEEMAQITYEQWFVRMKFPNHKTTPIDAKTGLPEGWKKRTCFDVMDVLSGGTPKTTIEEFWNGGIQFFTPKDATMGVYTKETEKKITKIGLAKCNSKLYPKNTLFITARGTVGKLNLASEAMAMNQSCYALRAKEGLTQYFLYCSLSKTIDAFKGAASGGVFDTIVVDTFKFLPFIQPAQSLIDAFDLEVTPLFNSVQNLLKQNQHLKEARDILLPRLMTGMIDVDKIKLPQPLDKNSQTAPTQNKEAIPSE